MPRLRCRVFLWAVGTREDAARDLPPLRMDEPAQSTLGALGNGRVHLGSSGDTYLIFNTDNVYHTDSDTDFEFAIRVSGVHTPDASWFV